MLQIFMCVLVLLLCLAGQIAIDVFLPRMVRFGGMYLLLNAFLYTSDKTPKSKYVFVIVVFTIMSGISIDNIFKESLGLGIVSFGCLQQVNCLLLKMTQLSMRNKACMLLL